MINHLPIAEAFRMYRDVRALASQFLTSGNRRRRPLAVGAVCVSSKVLDRPRLGLALPTAHTHLPISSWKGQSQRKCATTVALKRRIIGIVPVAVVLAAGGQLGGTSLDLPQLLTSSFLPGLPPKPPGSLRR